ncbi:MAG TPA: CocE/NonD family hydrolase [Kineosporiaceae bacterium]|nr:CocE/NonD family hydrolase [Kineosporiaceae bacterium]
MTTSLDPELPQTDTGDGDGRRPRDRARIVVAVAVLMMILGSLLARTVNTDGGSTSVTETAIFGADGHQISAYVYTPQSASATHRMPGIAMWHGLNNQKEYMSNTALELARRGFVVVSADQTGHGSSTGANLDAGCGGPDVLTYLRGLPTVDTQHIGLVGMSQGGFCAATAAALSQPDNYNSIFYMESEPNIPGVPDSTPFLKLHNIAYNIGTWTELGVMILVDKGSHANVSPELQATFATKDPITPGKVYGSIADGTARILYTPWEEHALSTDSPAAIGNAIDWMQRTLTDGKGLNKDDQIWPAKLLGTTVALAGAFLFLFAMGSVLLRTRAFGVLARPVPEYRGLTGAGWWVGALVTTAVGPLLYLWVWKHMFLTPWLAANALWPQTFTNVYMVWSVIVGVIAWALIAANHVLVTRRRGATLASYGVAESDGRLDRRAAGRALLMAVAVLAPVYAVLTFVAGAWHVDFRMWVVTLMPMTPARWHAVVGYVVPFAIYFLAQGIIFAGFLRWRKGKAPLWQEMLVNSVVLTLGALVWVLLCYVPFLTGGSALFGSDPNTATSTGMGGIYYLPLLVLWPLSACLYTYFFRKTGRVFVGSLLVTAVIVWSLVSASDFGMWPVSG